MRRYTYKENGKVAKQEELEVRYSIWLAISKEILDDGCRVSIVCREPEVRKDFSAFAGLQQEITVDDMLELEQNC